MKRFRVRIPHILLMTFFCFGSGAQLKPQEIASQPVISGLPSTGQQAESNLPDLPLIDQASRHALEYSQALPNFLVNQEIKRYVQSPRTKGWELQDTLEVELSFRADTGENFRLLRFNGAPTQKTYEELGGTTSTGEFGSILGGIFAPQSQASFRESGRDRIRGREAVVYDFEVKTANSRSRISDRNSGRAIVSGYEGRVWVAVQSGRVIRIELSHHEIPAGFPVSLAENAVEYDWVTIAEKEYLMPVEAEVLLGEDRHAFYTKNVIRFENYRKFEVGVKILPN